MPVAEFYGDGYSPAPPDLSGANMSQGQLALQPPGGDRLGEYLNTPEKKAAWAQWFVQLPLGEQSAVRNEQGKDLRGATRDVINQTRNTLYKDWVAGGRKGPLPPGMTADGGGTTLSPAERQSLITDYHRGVAEDNAAAQPGMDAYTQDPILNDTPTSYLESLRTSGVGYDEDIDPLAVEDQVRTDTTGVDAQKRSIAAYDDVIAQDGLTAIDRARVEQLRADTARRGRSQEQAILQDAAEQGRAGGNLSFLLRNQAQQAATNERAMGDSQTAAIGLARKDQAIQNRGFLGGDVQNAQDKIDQFNTEQSNRAVAQEWEREQDNRDANDETEVAAVVGDVDNTNETKRDDTREKRRVQEGNDAGEQAYWKDSIWADNNTLSVDTLGPAFNPVNRPAGGGQPGSNGIAEAGQGAIGGAAAGSAIAPGVGTVVGGAAGGLMGFLGGRKKKTSSNYSW